MLTLYDFLHWHNFLFTGTKRVYNDLVNITKNLEDLKSLQSNLSSRITEINQNFTQACNQATISDCPQLPALSNDFTAVSCVIFKELQ